MFFINFHKYKECKLAYQISQPGKMQVFNRGTGGKYLVNLGSVSCKIPTLSLVNTILHGNLNK